MRLSTSCSAPDGSRFASGEEFEGALEPEVPAPEAKNRSILMRELGQDRYRIVTAGQLLFFADDGTYDACPYHNWGACRAEGNAAGGTPITAPSSDPRCFFPS